MKYYILKFKYFIPGRQVVFYREEGERWRSTFSRYDTQHPFRGMPPQVPDPVRT